MCYVVYEKGTHTSSQFEPQNKFPPMMTVVVGDDTRGQRGGAGCRVKIGESGGRGGLCSLALQA